MKIQVRSLAIAFAIAVPITVGATAQSSAAPINSTSIKAAVPPVTTDVRYRARQDREARNVQRMPNDYPYSSYWGHPIYNSYSGHPYNSYWGRPIYNSYWGQPAYNSYRGYRTYNSYRGYPTYNSYWRYPTHYYPNFSSGWVDYNGW